VAPPTLVDTAGAATANTYLSRANAQAYFDARPFVASWTPASNDDKDIALLFATELLDRQKWLGTKGATPAGGLTQALAWPRRWAPTLEFDAAPDWVAEYFVDTSLLYYSELTIPAPIWKATAELALEILKAGTTDPFARSGFVDQNVKAKQIDVLSWEFFEPWLQARGLDRFPAVMQLIRPLLRSSGAPAIERV
jgi:hypothetical protein